MIEVVPLVSFPKSGNTWLRFVLANIFKANEEDVINFDNISNYTPTSIKDDLQLVQENLCLNSPVFIKEHYNYHSMPYNSYSKAIYIYRNGFDSLYSYWHFTNAQNPGYYRSLNSFSKCYWQYCGSWGEHVESWKNAATKKHDVFLISYEEMLSKPLETLKECMKFLEIDVKEEVLLRSLEASNKKNMKAMSGSSEFMKSKQKNFHFVRSGNTGEGEKLLPKSIQDDFLEYKYNAEMMIELGYLDSSTKLSSKIEVSNIQKIKCKLNNFRYRLINKVVKNAK